MEDKHLREKLSDEQREEFTDVFAIIDEDGSGAISTDEVSRGLENCGMRTTEAEVKDLVDRFDVNGDGELELFEWLELCAIVFLGKDDTETYNEMFKLASDGGAVTTSSLMRSLQRYVGSLGPFSESDVRAMLQHCGQELEDPGCISRDEFVQMAQEKLPSQGEEEVEGESGQVAA